MDWIDLEGRGIGLEDRVEGEGEPVGGSRCSGSQLNRIPRSRGLAHSILCAGPSAALVCLSEYRSSPQRESLRRFKVVERRADWTRGIRVVPLWHCGGKRLCARIHRLIFGQLLLPTNTIGWKSLEDLSALTAKCDRSASI